ncbi:unnamed protein product [Meloidogyne enterolobii]|uniref:Uncharacterized protein n=1 Tax=Meloidogyne enterolobii TaxID=390850 RepID=A0ACB0Y805_MELEN
MSIVNLVENFLILERRRGRVGILELEEKGDLITEETRGLNKKVERKVAKKTIVIITRVCLMLKQTIMNRVEQS